MDFEWKDLPDKTTPINAKNLNKMETKIVDSGWINLPLSNGITEAKFGGLPMYRKIGNVVYIKGGFKGISSSSKNIGTLPSGYRPITTLYIIAATGSKFATLQVSSASGIISVASKSDGTYNTTDEYSFNSVFVVE